MTESITVVGLVAVRHSAMPVFFDKCFQQPIPKHPRFSRLLYKMSTKRLSKVFIH